MKPKPSLACAFLAMAAIPGITVQAAAQEAATEAASDHPLGFMFGEWVGAMSGVTPNGQHYSGTQTERVGPMLGGDIVVIEGRGYSDNGDLSFNAFAIASPKSDGSGWEMRSYTGGNAGTWPFEPRENGFVWSVPAGPDARMRYTATFSGDSWSQIGEYVAEGREPVQTFRMNLRRAGPTDWPAAGAVEPRQGER